MKHCFSTAEKHQDWYICVDISNDFLGLKPEFCNCSIFLFLFCFVLCFCFVSGNLYLYIQERLLKYYFCVQMQHVYYKKSVLSGSCNRTVFIIDIF